VTPTSVTVKNLQSRIGSSLVLIIAAAMANSQIPLIHLRTYSSLGRPDSIISVDSGHYIFVTVDGANGNLVSHETNSSHLSSGIQIFRNTSAGLERFGFIPLRATVVKGLALLRNEQTIAVGLGSEGVAFINVGEALKGAARPIVLNQGPNSGSGYLAVTSDNKFLFVANEYGDLGNIGVIALNADDGGRVTHPARLGNIPTPNITPGLMLSPDNTRLYVVSEISNIDLPSKSYASDNSILTKDDCVQREGSRPTNNGLLYIIDVAKATTLKQADHIEQARAAIISRIPAGCSPVRVIEAPDSSRLYVSARGDNRILIFDPRLIEADPVHAFLRAISSGGIAPVGLQLLKDQEFIVVANSNRFGNGAGNAVILELRTGAIRRVLEMAYFPRNVAASLDGKTLYITNFGSNSFEVISLEAK
jgi:DNA-binding beta-propeller fold protein YncE